MRAGVAPPAATMALHKDAPAVRPLRGSVHRAEPIQRRNAPPARRPHPKPYFLFVGRLEKLKGVDALLSAWSGFDQADLLIVGEGPELGALRARAAGHPRI